MLLSRLAFNKVVLHSRPNHPYRSDSDTYLSKLEPAPHVGFGFLYKTRRHGMGWDGMGWHGMGWHGMGNKHKEGPADTTAGTPVAVLRQKQSMACALYFILSRTAGRVGYLSYYTFSQRVSWEKKVAPICWVIPPASASCTLVCLILSNSLVLPAHTRNKRNETK